MFRKHFLLQSLFLLFVVALSLCLSPGLIPQPAAAAPLLQTSTPPLPVVAIHVSEYTEALIPSYDSWWHYFVMYEALKESLDSDGTPWVTVSDADIEAGQLLHPDGSPRYPILFSLASESVSDAEIIPLKSYVEAGGFLFMGSSAFTRHTDGSTRGDFAFADEIGLHVVNGTHAANWYQNGNFTKAGNHRIVSHIPSGSLTWRMPLYDDQIPWGTSPSYSPHTNHYVWDVLAGGAEIIANASGGPLLAVNSYGDGQFIYHGALNPIIGHGSYDSGMYAYVIYRNAIEWAFETANLPIVKLSPWRYEYDAAFVIRHDFENTPSRINSIESSAQFEASVGAQGDYYFCTGVIRLDSEDPQMTPAQKQAAQLSIQRAVLNYGATIGSHNGGLPNPVNQTLAPSHYHYWHWGTDEALDVDPATLPPEYADGYDYAKASVQISFEDIEGWMAGLDNGRDGCGTTGDCPRTWVSPFLNSTREGSNQIMEELGSIIMGENKTSPFPHWALSYETPGYRFPHLSIPTSDWYKDGRVRQSMEDGHDVASVHAAIDFYHDLGALANIYMHSSSASGLPREYVTYNLSKPRMWAANAVSVFDWWTDRSAVTVLPSYSKVGTTAIAGAQISGATDPETAVELVIPYWETGAIEQLQVFFDAVPADPADYRVTDYGLKAKVGTTVSEIEVRYTPLAGWVQTDWVGGSGQDEWSDETRYASATGIDDSVGGQLRLGVAAGGALLFSDDFVRPPLPDPVPFDWVVPSSAQSYGAYEVQGGILNSGTSQTRKYGHTYTDTFSFTDHSVEADISFPNAGTFGGGIVARLDPTNGQHYAAWIYPDGSSGGSNVLKLIKYRSWDSWNGQSMNGSPVSLGSVGNGWHHLKMSLEGNRIRVYYDGELKIDVVDNNFDNRPAFTGGYVGGDCWTNNNTYGPSYNNFVVRDGDGNVLLSDDFGTDAMDQLSPWIKVDGNWDIVGESLVGTRTTAGYSSVYTDALWTDYTVEGRIKFTPGGYGGGLGGRVDPATGAHYAAWVYPDGSPGGSNVMRLIKYRTWTSWNGQSMNGSSISLPAVGTDWHTLKMDFEGNRIRVYYDGNLVVDVTDNNYDSRPAYMTGGVSVDMYRGATDYAFSADDIFVRTPAEYGSSGTLLSSAFDGGVGVRWQNIAWNAAAGGTTGARVRTRTAARSNLLPSAPWSDWYASSAVPVTNPDERWIQYEVELSSADTSATPVFYENAVTYVPGILLPGTQLKAVAPLSGDSESNISLSATLVDDDENPVVGRSVTFALGDLDIVTGTTGAGGVANVSLDLLTAPGAYSLTVTFAGDAQYAPISGIYDFAVLSPWDSWIQDTQADFESGTLEHLDTTILPGSVQLEGTMVGQGEESGAFALAGQVPPLENWFQTDWSGGDGQAIWSDATRYASSTNIDTTTPGELRLSLVSGGDVLFGDDFTRPPLPEPRPFDWIVPTTSPVNGAVFDTTGGLLNSTTQPVGRYGYAYTDTLTMVDHSVEADLRFSQAGAFGGGIFGRLNTSNGQRYSVWVYPAGSSGVPGGYGPAVIKLIKYYDWGAWGSPLGLQTVSIPDVGDDWHHLKITFSGAQIQVFYDGSEVINVTDTDADGHGIYAGGFGGVDFYTSGNTYAPTYNNFEIRDATQTLVLGDNFGDDVIDPLLPWLKESGTWNIVDGVLLGSSAASQYAYVYTDTMWTDYVVAGRIRFPAGAFGGGLGGRVDPATGAHYGAWVYPEGGSSSPKVLKLIKYRDWTTWSGTPMQQVSLPDDVGTGWHTLQLAFEGNRIRVYYDGALLVDVTDNDFDSRPAYATGGVSVDMWTQSTPYVMSADDILVRTLPEYTGSGSLLSSAFDSGLAAQWQHVTWNAAAGGDTGVRVRTRTADQQADLSAMPWSAWINTSGSAITSPDKRWIQYEVELGTADTTISPVLYDLNFSYTFSGSDIWNYRRRLFIDNQIAGELPAGYSVRLDLDTAALVAAGKLRPDGRDLRIVWDNAGTLVELDRVAETAFNTASTEIWFKTQAPIPASARDSNYYIYYGNPYAGEAPSDPREVWSLWDGFDGDAVDTSVWQQTGSVAVNGGIAHLATGANLFGHQPFTNTLLEMRLRLSQQNQATSAWWGWEEIPSNADNMVIYEENTGGLQAWINWNGSGYEHIDITGAPDRTDWHTYAMQWWDGNAIWKIDGQPVATRTYGIPTVPMYANLNAPKVPYDVAYVKGRTLVDKDPLVTLATPQPGYLTEGRFESIAYDTQQFSGWKYLVWDADTPPDTHIQLRVRTAATQQQLITAPWQDYAQSGLLVNNPSGRWVQLAAQLTTEEDSLTPVLHKVILYYTGLPAALSLSPVNASILAGESVTYTAQVASGGDTWDVTEETPLDIDAGAGGSWTGTGGYLNIYNSEFIGDWTVNGTYAGLNTSTGLTVDPAQPVSITLTPDPHTLVAGESVSYQVMARDSYNNRWDATGDAAYTIPPAAGGSWTANTYTSEFAGDWSVQATLSGQQDSAMLHVEHGAVAALYIAPETESVVAGSAVAYTVMAEDDQGNTWDVTAQTTFETPIGAGGSWLANVYTTAAAGEWEVLARYAGYQAIADLTVSHTGMVDLHLLPASTAVTAGDAVTYTVLAEDAYGNTWYVTSGTSFSASPEAGGSWLANVYTSAAAGTWTVGAVFDGQMATAELRVFAGEITGLALKPVSSTLLAGERVTYTVMASDEYGNIWDVTPQSQLEIPAAAGGSWAANTYTAQVAGSWTVTATLGDLLDTATLDVGYAVVTGLAVTPMSASLVAGEAVTYTAAASDDYGNTWDVTAQTTFTLPVAARGNWSANVYTGAAMGQWPVHASYEHLHVISDLTVSPSVALYLHLSPEDITIVAGDSLTYTATAEDAYANTWDITAQTTFSTPLEAAGLWSGNAYTSEVTGDWTVYARADLEPYATVTGMAQLYVVAGQVSALHLTPMANTVIAGDSVTYSMTAEDALGNRWDVTPHTLFTVSSSAGGQWSDNIYTAGLMGTWSITGTYQAMQVTADLTVTHAGAQYLHVNPDDIEVAAGESVTYTAMAEDAYGNLWDVTPLATFEVIESAAGGSWLANTYTTAHIGNWQIAGTYQALSDTVSLQVNPASLDRLFIVPAVAEIVAGESISYAVTAQDTLGNQWDVTAQTDFSIPLAAGGSWSGPNTYTGEFAGVWDITATYGGVTTTAQLTVTHAGAFRLQIAPNPATVASGDPLTYTALAEDTYGNTWDVTSETAFSIAGSGHGGAWQGNVYTAGIEGTWQVQGKYQGLTTLATLHVVHGVPHRLSLSPAKKTIQAGGSVTYQAVAEDGAGNTWDVTAQVAFSILESGAGGSWVDNTYTSAGSGLWTVAGTYTYAAGQTLTGTAQLEVLPAAAQSLSLLPSSATIASGVTISYTAMAEDSYGNTWDVTADTAFDLPQSAGGNWRGNVYTGGLVGIWEVSGQYDKLWATAALTVTRGAVTFLTLTPAEATVKAGEAVTYTATAADTARNTWDATAETTFSIAEPGAAGVWNANRYTSGQPGDWTVVGAYEAVTGDALLHVEPVEQPQNPVPVALSLDPEAVDAQSGALTLTVRGRDFVAGAQVTWDGVAQTTEVLSATEVQTLIAAALVLEPGAVNIRVVNPGPGGGTSAPLTFTVRPVAGPMEYAIYLPLVQLSPEEEVVELPDLVVKSVLVQGWDVEVVIENQGPGSVSAEDVFWVDLYVKPSPPPSGVNDTWSDGRCSQGIVWGVSGEVLPLEPGEILTLTFGDDYYWGVYSNFNGNLPAGVPIYVQVDSANLQSDYGSVLETHEESGGPYNNILGPVDSQAPAAAYDHHPRLASSPRHQPNLPPRR